MVKRAGVPGEDGLVGDVLGEHGLTQPCAPRRITFSPRARKSRERMRSRAGRSSAVAARCGLLRRAGGRRESPVRASPPRRPAWANIDTATGDSSRRHPSTRFTAACRVGCHARRVVTRVPRLAARRTAIHVVGIVNLFEGSALLPREIDAPDRFQQAHITASIHERAGAEQAVVSRPQEVSTDSEEILHDTVNRREPLELSGRLETPHLALR